MDILLKNEILERCKMFEKLKQNGMLPFWAILYAGYIFYSLFFHQFFILVWLLVGSLLYFPIVYFVKLDKYSARKIEAFDLLLWYAIFLFVSYLWH